MSSRTDPVAPVSTPASMLREATGVFEIAGLWLRAAELARAPRGDGHPVFVLPGFGADGRSTWPVRTFLTGIGYDTNDWGRGRNVGDVAKAIEAMGVTVRDVRARVGRRVSLVGWSLGGYIAREVARDEPSAVRAVVTFGSPVIGGPRFTTAARAAARRGWDMDSIDRIVSERKRTPLRVPVTAIYSRRDGVVDWRACIDDEEGGPIEHVEVGATHVGLGFSADVFRIVADRLAAS